jgi:hypothetical protein
MMETADRADHYKRRPVRWEASSISSRCIEMHALLLCHVLQPGDELDGERAQQRALVHARAQ